MCVSYVVFGWGPMRMPPCPIPRVARCACRTWGAALTLVVVKRQKGAPVTQGDYHWMLRFGRGRSDDSLANCLADSLDGLFHLVQGPHLPDRIILYRVPKSIIQKGGLILVDDLLREDNQRDVEDRLEELDLLHAVGSICLLPETITEEIWRLLPSCHENKIFRALTFLRTSYQEVYLSPGDRWHRPSSGPPISAVDAASFESAFQNAYKAIEAIVGDPNKDDRRFENQIRAAGLDPSARIGWEEKASLFGKIRSMTVARDKRAAHGSTPRQQPIEIGELMDWQECARFVVYCAAQQVLRRSN